MRFGAPRYAVPGRALVSCVGLGLDFIFLES